MVVIDKRPPGGVYPTPESARFSVPLKGVVRFLRDTTTREKPMPGKKPGPSIKRPKTYEALKKKGMSKTRAAKISNAQAKKS